MAAKDKVPTGSLMVFSKARLFFLFITSMLIGTAFFFFGFFMGYNTGKSEVIKNIKQSIKQNRKLDAKIANRLKLQQEEQEDTFSSNFIYNVHIGLFSNPEYATQAWQEVADYSKLNEKEAIKEIKINKQNFYQVTVGIFANEAGAKTFANIISTRSNYKISPIISRTAKPIETITKQEPKKESAAMEIIKNITDKIDLKSVAETVKTLAS